MDERAMRALEVLDPPVAVGVPDAGVLPRDESIGADNDVGRQG
jgi:hypothetical protein